MTVVGGYVKAWVTQRLANRLPIWSRARLEDDSVFQMVMNPAGAVWDEVYAGLTRIKFDYYSSTASQTEQPFLYILQLPLTFAFDYDEHEAGKFTWHPPIVSATTDSGTVVPELAGPNRHWRVERDGLAPTRVTATLLSSAKPLTIIPTVLLTSLSSALIADAGVDGMGTVYVHIDEGEIFGRRDERGVAVAPRVFIKGVMRGHRIESTEAIPVNTNGIIKSRRDWKEIVRVWVEGISGDQATIKVDFGFGREQVSDQLALIATPLSEFAKTLSISDMYAPPVFPAP